MEVTSSMRPAGCLSEARSSIRARFTELAVPFVAVRLKYAACLSQMMVDVVFLPVRSKIVDRTMAEPLPPRDVDHGHIRPDPALFTPFA